MTERKSRLSEIDYSEFNLRDAYITDQADYLSLLRDEALFSNFGIKVLVRIPVDEWGEVLDNNIDEYSNFVDVTWEDTTESVIPLFKEYRQVLSEEGMTADGTDGLYPLEVIIPSKLHLPRNSRLIFTEYNCREEKIAREWTVLGTQMKQLSGSKTYSRVANCVPSRQTTFDSLDVNVLGIIYFGYYLGTPSKSTLKASGTIWFSKNYVAKGAIKKKYITDIILEDTSDDTTYLESISTKYQYVSLPKYIQYTTNNFTQNELVSVYVSSGGQNIPVMIQTDEAGTTTQLKILVTAVDTNGKLLGYKFVPEEGYTVFETQTTAKIQSFDTSGVLHSYEQIPSSLTTLNTYTNLPVSKNIITNIDTNNNVVRYALVIDSVASLNNLNVIAIKTDSIFANIKAISVQETNSAIQETPVLYDTDGIPKYITPYRMEARFLAKKVAIAVLD